MSHPLDQLTPFVDAVLDPDERALVERHLRSCARCRREVAQAAAAREAVRALPTPQAPDIASHFSPERLGELAQPSSAERSPWSKAAPFLAAAAVVALVALAVPRLGGSSGDTGTSADAAAEAGGAGSAEHPRLEIDATDYDAASLDAAAAAYASSLAGDTAGGAGFQDAATDAPSAEDQGAPGAATSAAAAPDQNRVAGPERSARAVRCLRRAFPGFPGEIVRVSQATFQGTPAFLGYVLESPGAGTPPDTLSLWVAAIEDCSILSISSVRL